MTLHVDDDVLRAAFAEARRLEPGRQEVALVLTRAECAGVFGRARPRVPWARQRRRLAVAAAVVAVALAGGGYATAPPLRAAIEDAAGTFSGWLAGDDGGAPGRPVQAGDRAPDYFRDPRYTGDPRVIAEAGGYKLFAAREVRSGPGWVQFDLGNTGYGTDMRASDFEDQTIIVLGPAATDHADEDGHVPLFGVTARNVRRVELTYASGPPLRVDDVAGGFVLLAEPARSPRAVVAFDGRGQELGRVLVDDSDHPGARIHWSEYGPPAPLVPSECQPGVVGTSVPKRCARFLRPHPRARIGAGERRATRQVG